MSRKGIRMGAGVLKNNINQFTIDWRRRAEGFDMGQSHYHPYYEIYYLCSGKCRMFIHDTIYYAEPGDMFLIPPSRLHRAFYSTAGGASRYNICFVPEYSFAFAEHNPNGLTEIFLQPKLWIHPGRRQELERLLRGMEQEVLRPEPYSALQAQSLLLQLLILIWRLRHQEQPPDETLVQPDAAIQEAVHYIQRCHRETVTLKSAAGIAHMSPAYFSKKFKDVTGFGFKEYLTNVRIQDSENLLLSTALPVTEIALACGFSDGNYFGDAFKKVKGISPNQFRKQQE